MGRIKIVLQIFVGVMLIFFVSYALDGFGGTPRLFLGSFLMLGGVCCAVFLERRSGLWFVVLGVIYSALAFVLGLSGHFLQYFAGGYVLYFASNITCKSFMTNRLEHNGKM